jgi:ribonuclease G
VKREILMNTTAKETRVAILEDDVLVELMVERPDAARMVGDIYKGKVEAVLPGIQAAFVNIGTEKGRLPARLGRGAGGRLGRR